MALKSVFTMDLASVNELITLFMKKSATERIKSLERLLGELIMEETRYKAKVSAEDILSASNLMVRELLGISASMVVRTQVEIDFTKLEEEDESSL